MICLGIEYPFGALETAQEAVFRGAGVEFVC